MLRGVQSAAKHRPDIEVIYYDNKNDAARSVENARAAAVVKPDVYISYNATPATNSQIGRVLKDAGVPILSVQNRVPDTPIFAVDNALSGYEACRRLSQEAKEALGREAAGDLRPFPKPDVHRARRRLQEGDGGAIARHADPGAIDESGTARWSIPPTSTRNAKQKVIIWAHVDSMAISALTAARNSSTGKAICW